MKLNMNFTMDNPVTQLFTELNLKGVTQSSVAITYAYIMAQEGESADWTTINAAIRGRWKGASALERVKHLAWKQYEEWANSWGGVPSKTPSMVA